jgi:hypothetical protein
MERAHGNLLYRTASTANFRLSAAQCSASVSSSARESSSEWELIPALRELREPILLTGMKFRVEQRGERQAERVPFAVFGVASGI